MNGGTGGWLRWTFCLFALGATVPLRAESVIPTELQGKSLAHFFHAYVTATGSGPQSVLDVDNNVELVFACQTPQDLQTLQSRKIEVTESQLLLLAAWHLLEQDDQGRFQTSFPILGPSKTAELRRMARQAAEKIASELDPDIHRFLNVLESRGWQKNGFTLLFSLVLDGLVWDILEERGTVPPREISAESPFWAGTVWVLYPQRALSCGTNTVAEGGLAVKINWSPQAIPQMHLLVTGRGMEALFSAARSGGASNDPQVRRMFQGYGLFDEKGTWVVPNLRANAETDPVYGASQRLAARVAERLDEGQRSDALQRLIGAGARSDLVIIFYHELMWELLDLLDERNLVHLPGILRGEAQREQVGQLVFIVKD